MEKILIVNDNLNMGGIQKSLINFINNIHDDYDVTLLLFSPSGTMMDELPENINLLIPPRAYALLGMNKAELAKYPMLFVLKAFLMLVAHLTTRRTAMKLLGFLCKQQIDNFDVAISYSHLTQAKGLSNGCGDYVLDQVKARKKLCFIHCDYLHAGYLSEENNAEYREYDRIVCCSESVRNRFIEGAQIDEDKALVLRNFLDVSVVAKAACETEIKFDHSYINLLTVARLSIEKGIERVINALSVCERDDIRYYIIGDGPQKDKLKELIHSYQLEDKIYLLGEKSNPYPYMNDSDYLIVPSYHEAAPIVFDEANILGLPIISTNTTSAKEMIESGIVSDDITDVLAKLQKTKRNQPLDVKHFNQKNAERFKEIIT